MAVPLSWSTFLGYRVTLSPGETQLSPCKKRMLKVLLLTFSFLEVSSYTNPKSSLPLLWASPIPRSVRNGHATAQGFNLTCEQSCSVAASAPLARQCWALKPPGDAACPWVSHMQGYTSKIPVQGLRRLCNDSAHVLPLNNICCCKRHPGLMPPCFVLWSCQMLPASQRHSQMCLVWGPKRVFPRGFSQRWWMLGHFPAHIWIQGKDGLPASRETKKWCPHWSWNLKSRCL